MTSVALIKAAAIGPFLQAHFVDRARGDDRRDQLAAEVEP
jgi:hypothetical protein